MCKFIVFLYLTSETSDSVGFIRRHRPPFLCCCCVAAVVAVAVVAAAVVAVLLLLLLLFLLLLPPSFLLPGFAFLLFCLPFPVPHSVLSFIDGLSSLIATASIHCRRRASPLHDPRIFTLKSVSSPLCISALCFAIAEFSGRNLASSRCSLNLSLMVSPVSPLYLPLQVS